MNADDLKAVRFAADVLGDAWRHLNHAEKLDMATSLLKAAVYTAREQLERVLRRHAGGPVTLVE